jgi:hypothetical protein
MVGGTCAEILKERSYWEDIDVDVKIILQWIIIKYDMIVCFRFLRSRRRFCGELL